MRAEYYDYEEMPEEGGWRSARGGEGGELYRMDKEMYPIKEQPRHARGECRARGRVALCPRDCYATPQGHVGLSWRCRRNGVRMDADSASRLREGAEVQLSSSRVDALRHKVLTAASSSQV